jgi:hypothetical protein|nr:MAG TPA: Protein of unknown function (DUF3290) [Caudoviricetes sp.]
MDFVILLILLFIALFFLCRELLCWYWKVNERINNQKEIIRLLKKLAKEEDTPTQDKSSNGFNFLNPMKPKVYNS